MTRADGHRLLYSVTSPALHQLLSNWLFLFAPKLHANNEFSFTRLHTKMEIIFTLIKTSIECTRRRRGNSRRLIYLANSHKASRFPQIKKHSLQLLHKHNENANTFAKDKRTSATLSSEDLILISSFHPRLIVGGRWMQSAVFLLHCRAIVEANWADGYRVEDTSDCIREQDCNWRKLENCSLIRSFNALFALDQALTNKCIVKRKPGL